MKRYSANQAYLDEHLHRMHHDIEIITRKLELEKRRLHKLDEEVQRAKGEYEDKVMPPRSGAAKKETPRTPANTAVSAPLKALESRLENKLRKLDIANHDSSQLREEIDQIRRERLAMNSVFKRLHEEIKNNGRTITGLCQESDGARDITDDANRRVVAMKRKLEAERNVFKTDVLRLHEEMKHQDRERKEWEVKLYKEQYGRSSKTEYLVADEEGEFSEDSLMKRILKLAFLNCIQRRHIKQHQKNIEVFEQAFATIKSTTGISDIEEIVKIFVKLEERNFSLLTYVNQLNREIESFEKQSRDMREREKSVKVEEERTNMRRRAALADTEQQLHQTQTQIDENNAAYQVHKEILEQAKPAIFAVARRLEKETKGAAVAPTETSNEYMLQWLLYVERTLSQWREFLPEARSAGREPGFKPFAYTVGSSVKQLPPKKTHGAVGPLLKTSDLPVAQLEEKRPVPGAQTRNENEDESDEEDYGERPWTMAELKEKSLSSLAKRRRIKGGGARGQAERGEDKAGAEAQKGGKEEGKDTEREVDYKDMVKTGKAAAEEEEDAGSEYSDGDGEEVGGEPTDDELNEIFLKRYKMSKEELQAMADKMGIQLNNLCYLKQEFDAYDEDRSGYIDVKELRELLHKLGEELTEEELEQAFKELDADGSGEIEFFEFVEWFTSED